MSESIVEWVLSKNGDTMDDTLEWQHNIEKLLSGDFYGIPKLYFHKNEDGTIRRALLFRTSEDLLRITMKTYNLKVGYFIRGIRFLVSKEP